MKKFLVLLALVGLVAAPAQAGFGILNSTGTGFVDLSGDVGNYVGTFVVTIGFHTTAPMANALALKFHFVYDSAEMIMLGAAGVSPFANPTINNINGTISGTDGLPKFLADNITHGAGGGLWGIGSNWVGVGPASGTATYSMDMAASVYYPVARFTFMQMIGNDDMYYDFYVDYGDFYLWNSVNSTTAIVRKTGFESGVVITPEPGSVALLIAGFAGIGGGLWRRRSA